MENFIISLVDEIKEAKPGEVSAKDGNAQVSLKIFLSKKDNDNGNIDSENNIDRKASNASTNAIDNEIKFQEKC